MKTILKIVVILLMAALVAGGFTLVVNQTASVSSLGADGTRPERPEGQEEGGAVGMGLLQVLVTLAKLSGIVILVLLAEKALGRALPGKLQTGLPNQ